MLPADVEIRRRHVDILSGYVDLSFWYVEMPPEDVEMVPTHVDLSFWYVEICRRHVDIRFGDVDMVRNYPRMLSRYARTHPGHRPASA